MMNKPITLCDRCDICMSCLLDYDGLPCRKNRTVEPTYADLIRAMTEKGLANAIVRTYGEGGICPPKHTHIFCALDSGCNKCWLDWLMVEKADEGE